MADVLFRGGSVRTGNPEEPRAGAVAVRDGRVLAVGDHALDAVGRGVTTVDLAQGQGGLPLMSRASQP